MERNKVGRKELTGTSYKVSSVFLFNGKGYITIWKYEKLRNTVACSQFPQILSGHIAVHEENGEWSLLSFILRVDEAGAGRGFVPSSA